MAICMASFGQRIIDGKVPQFRTAFAAASKVEGSGTMLDLSQGGCRIESPIPVFPDYSLELRIHVPDLDWPIMIEKASVQWVSGLMFGLAFLQLREAERQRLEQLVQHLLENQR